MERQDEPLFPPLGLVVRFLPSGSTQTAVADAELTRLASAIIELRGERVILDSDLAEIYDVETKRLNEQVKRNAERFVTNTRFN